MESFEKIINNCDVLEVIFGYLDFKEHLKLINICPQFEYAIVHGAWRLMCKNLYIMADILDTFLLKYNAVNNVMPKRSLTPEEMQIILHHSSMYIQKLDLNRIRCLENIISLKYHNLTDLSLCEIFLEDTHLQQVAENCLNLESLSLINFMHYEKESKIRANVFGEMKALNKLEIDDTGFDAWDYFDIQQLFCLAHLKTLNININIRHSYDYTRNGSNNNSTDRVYNIENLKMGILTYLQSGSICFIQDLIRFENLKKLSIRLDYNHLSLDDKVLAQINNACPTLCELSFVGCDLKFKEFPRMNYLKHLTFALCSNINVRNFNEIFRKLKLKSLSLVDVEMSVRAEDISDYNYISKSLESLTITVGPNLDTVRTFCNRQHKFENVSKVRLVTDYILHSELTGLCFSHNFPNLQELITNSFSISSEDILHLKHLKVLEFGLFDDMSWSYLEMLFKHPTLTHITITPSRVTNFKMHNERLPICCEGLTTTLEYLSLPFVVYESALSFWPSFRQMNKLLKLEIADCDTSKREETASMTLPIQYLYWRLWSKFVN